MASLPPALYALGQTLFSMRPHLKHDLEILQMLDPADPNYKLVKAYVDRAIVDKYGRPSPPWIFSWQGVVVGLAGCVFMILWTVKLRSVGYRYWPWLTGVIASVFFSQFAASLREKTMAAKRKASAPAKLPPALTEPAQ